MQLDDAAETGAAEERQVAFVEIGRDTGYATARSVTDAVLRELGWPGEYTASDHPIFVPGRGANLSVDGKPLGILGEVHPEVLTNFGLTNPVALAELTLARLAAYFASVRSAAETQFPFSNSLPCRSMIRQRSASGAPISSAYSARCLAPTGS